MKKATLTVILLMPLWLLVGCASARRWATEQAIQALEEQQRAMETKMETLVGPAPADDAPMSDKLSHVVRMIEAMKKHEQTGGLPADTIGLWSFIVLYIIKQGVLIVRAKKAKAKTK